jgi:hypothetical protein
MALCQAFESFSSTLLAECAELSALEYPGAPVTSANHLRWKYIENPQGPAIASTLRDDGRLVGRIVIQPRSVRVHNTMLRGGYLVDLLIHPHHRGLKAFMLLMGPLKKIEGFDFLYVTPNAQSMELYRSLLKFPELMKLTVVACPVTLPLLHLPRWAAPLAALGSRITHFVTGGVVATLQKVIGCSVSDDPPEQAELKLLEERWARDSARGVRDEAFSAWRFTEQPHVKHHYIVVRSEGAFKGMAVVRRASYAGYEVVFLLEFNVLPTAPRGTSLLLQLGCLQLAAKTGAEIVLGFFNTNIKDTSSHALLPLLSIPDRFLPQPVPLFTVSLRDGGAEALVSTRLLVSLADFDMF